MYDKVSIKSDITFTIGGGGTQLSVHKHSRIIKQVIQTRVVWVPGEEVFLL